MKHSLKELELKNGAKGLVVDVPGADVVNFLIEFRAGFDLGSWKKYELPHVIEHMMFTNRSYPKSRQFSKEVEKNGAFNNAYTSSDSLEYEYECAEFEAQRIAELIAVQITEPTFPAPELGTEIGNVREELSNMLSNHQSVCYDNLVTAGLGRPNLNTRIQQLPKITAPNLTQYYKKTHLGANMRFIIAGNTDFSGLTRILDVPLPKGKRAVLPHIKFRHQPHPLIQTQPIQQIYYDLFSIYGKQLNYRQLIAARIIISLLANGFSSTLFGLAREKGLVYGLRLSVGAGVYDTGMRFGGFVTPANAAAYFKLAKTEIAKAKAGKFSLKQFENTKTLMLGERARNYQRVGNLTGYYEDFFEEDKYEDFETYNNLMLEIGKDEAVAAFNCLFADKCWGLSFVGDINQQTAAQLHRYLSPLW